MTTHVLILCTHNSARSVLSEGMLNHWAKKLGRGQDYAYPHDEPGGVADQPLLPSGLEGERFYEPTDRGFEAGIKARLEELRKRKASWGRLLPETTGSEEQPNPHLGEKP